MNPVAQGIIIENLFLDCITNNNFTFTSNDIDPLRTAPDTSIGINLLAQTYSIRNVNVQHFTIGILTNPVMTNASGWVNTGENKNVDTCTAGRCSIGFFFDAGDCHTNNIVSAHCFIGVVNSATTGTNYHIWGFDYIGILLRNATSRIVNLQIESDLSNGDINANGTVSPKDSHLPDGYTRTWIAVQSHAKAFLSRVDMWNVCSAQHAVLIQVLDDSLAIIDNVAVTQPNTGTKFLPVPFWANNKAFISITSLFIDPRFAVYDKSTHWDIPAVGLVYTTTSSTLDTTSDLRYVQKVKPDMMKTVQLIDATKLP